MVIKKEKRERVCVCTCKRELKGERACACVCSGKTFLLLSSLSY